MITIGDTIDTSPSEALELLRTCTNKFGVFINYDRLLDIQSMVYESQKPFLKAFRLMAGNDTITVNNTQALPSIYITRLGVSESLLINRDRRYNAGADVRKKILESHSAPETAKTFAKLHNILAYYQGILKNLNQFVDLPLCNNRDKYGNRMLLARPEYNLLSTARLQASAPNVQNLSREFSDLITEPEGYTLLRTDSGQIEPRIMYSAFIKDDLIKHLILLYEDAYFGVLHFILLSIQQEMDCRNLLTQIDADSRYPNPPARTKVKLAKLNKMNLTKEMRSDVKLAALAAGYGSGLVGKEVPYAQEYVEKINNHPLKKKLLEEIEAHVARGGDTFYTPFGLAITPDETEKYKKDSVAWHDHLVRCGVNNPIQATSSQLMCESVSTANSMLRGTQSHIAYYKHDEGAFYIHDSEPYLLKALSDVTAYQVQDWIPIYSDPFIGVKEGSGFGKDFQPQAIQAEIQRVSLKYNLAM